MRVAHAFHRGSRLERGRFVFLDGATEQHLLRAALESWVSEPRLFAADPDNHRYQAIVHRARAELALLDGRVVDASWEAEKAWACAPRDPRIQVLRDSLRARS